MSVDDDAPQATHGPGREEPAPELSAPLPLAQAARSLEKMTRPFGSTLGVHDLVAELQGSIASDDDPEIVLYSQARVLDALFKRIVLHDMHSKYADVNGIPFLNNDKLDFALRSQKQSRRALEIACALRRYREEKESKE